MNMYQTTEHKGIILITYLNKYLTKRNLLMKDVIKGIIERIEANQSITPRQFNSIIKFIERESEFVTLNRSEIFNFFKPLMISNKARTSAYEPNDITQFLTQS